MYPCLFILFYAKHNTIKLSMEQQQASGVNKNMKPIFIFSLPRSGSTLLQKIIMSSEEISSVTEPWIMLPLVYMQKTEGALSEYSSKFASLAINEINSRLLINNSSIDKNIRDMVLNIYKGLSNTDSKYFLDKTPRYYLIIDDIIRIFPDAKFIFLFRNPLSIYASKLNTGRFGKFKSLYIATKDLDVGPNLLANAYKKHHENSLKLVYEDLIERPDIAINKIEKYLSVSLNKEKIKKLSSIELVGSMGDPSLLKKEKEKITTNNKDTWIQTFNTPTRKLIAIKHLKGITNDYYNYLGIERNVIISNLKQINTDIYKTIFQTPQDIYHIFYLFIMKKFKLYLFLSKRYKWTKDNFLG